MIFEGRKDGAGINGGAIVVKKESGFYFPPRDEALAYDDDGNLIQDGRWNWEWAGENRLKAMETNATAAAAGVPLQRLEFVYDSQSRRIRKLLKEWDAVQETFVLKKDTRFLYDGWNVIAEFDASPSLPASASPRLAATYAWGLDLSGTETGAGGVGGLLLAKVYSTTANNSQPPSTSLLAPCYDGNGNVMAYVDCVSTAVVARYEYDPFGREVIQEEAASLSSAGGFAFRFSTKYTDEESGLLYYGYRYYSADLGRWLSRDPIEERGGLSLFGMVANNALNWVDYLGFQGVWPAEAANGVGQNADSSPSFLDNFGDSDGKKDQTDWFEDNYAGWVAAAKDAARQKANQEVAKSCASLRWECSGNGGPVSITVLVDYHQAITPTNSDSGNDNPLTSNLFPWGQSNPNANDTQYGDEAGGFWQSNRALGRFTFDMVTVTATIDCTTCKATWQGVLTVNDVVGTTGDDAPWGRAILGLLGVPQNQPLQRAQWNLSDTVVCQ